MSDKLAELRAHTGALQSSAGKVAQKLEEISHPQRAVIEGVLGVIDERRRLFDELEILGLESAGGPSLEVRALERAAFDAEYTVRNPIEGVEDSEYVA